MARGGGGRGRGGGRGGWNTAWGGDRYGTAEVRPVQPPFQFQVLPVNDAAVLPSELTSKETRMLNIRSGAAVIRTVKETLRSAKERAFKHVLPSTLFATAITDTVSRDSQRKGFLDPETHVPRLAWNSVEIAPLMQDVSNFMGVFKRLWNDPGMAEHASSTDVETLIGLVKSNDDYPVAPFRQKLIHTVALCPTTRLLKKIEESEQQSAWHAGDVEVNPVIKLESYSTVESLVDDLGGFMELPRCTLAGAFLLKTDPISMRYTNYNRRYVSDALHVLRVRFSQLDTENELFVNGGELPRRKEGRDAGAEVEGGAGIRAEAVYNYESETAITEDGDRYRTNHFNMDRYLDSTLPQIDEEHDYWHGWGPRNRSEIRRKFTSNCVPTRVNTDIGDVETMDQRMVVHIKAMTPVWIPEMVESARYLTAVIDITTRLLYPTKLNDVREGWDRAQGLFSAARRNAPTLLSQHVRVRLAYGATVPPSVDDVNGMPMEVRVCTGTTGMDSGVDPGEGWKNRPQLEDGNEGMVVHLIGAGVPLTLKLTGDFLLNHRGYTFPYEMEAYALLLRLTHFMEELIQSAPIARQTLRFMLYSVFEAKLDQQVINDVLNFRDVEVERLERDAARRRRMEDLLRKGRSAVDLSNIQNGLVGVMAPVADDNRANLDARSYTNAVQHLLRLMLRTFVPIEKDLIEKVSIQTSGFPEGGMLVVGYDDPSWGPTSGKFAMIYTKMGSIRAVGPNNRCWNPPMALIQESLNRRQISRSNNNNNNNVLLINPPPQLPQQQQEQAMLAARVRPNPFDSDSIPGNFTQNMGSYSDCDTPLSGIVPLWTNGLRIMSENLDDSRPGAL